MSVLELKKKAVHPFARRFFAGETLEDALSRVRDSNGLGMGVTIDFLGEDVADLGEARVALNEYRRILDAVASGGLDCTLAIKLTHIGLKLDREAAADGALEIAATAREKGAGLWVDMEGSAHTGDTIEVYRRVRKIHPDTGIALQAMLHRTWDDLKALAAEGSLIRLVKGAYDEPPGIALTSMKDIRIRYIEMMEYLFGHAGRFAIGTHDMGIIDAAFGLMEKGGAQVEFQMLMGIRDGAKQELVEGGQRVVEYVPYGTDWYGYGMRRIMEKKRNITYFAGGLIGR